MTTKRVNLLLAMSLCGFWGCSRSKPLDTAEAQIQSPVEAPAPIEQSKPLGTVEAPKQPPVETPAPVEQKREEVPAPAPPIATKPVEKPAAVPKVSLRKNAVVKPETKKPAHEASSKIAASVEKPAAVPKVSSSKNAVVPPETKKPAPEESPKIAAKNETTQRKPAEMKVANELDRNGYLSAIVKPLLPPRTTVMDAAAGFKDQRQFISAVHLSRNLGIPFSQIKLRMTGEHRMSLNDSLRDFHPQMTKDAVKAAVKKAGEQAKVDESRAKDDSKKAAAREKLAANRKS